MDVRLPDGTVIQGVPDGMSKADLVSKLKANGYDTSGLEPPQTTPGIVDRLKANAKMQAGAIGGAYKDLTLGALRGAGSIGATLLSSPQQIREDISGGPGSSERRNAMTEATQTLGADPSSALYKAGKLGGEVTGTLGVGGGLARVGAGLGAPANVLQAIGTAGMSGGKAITRAAGGAITGGRRRGL